MTDTAATLEQVGREGKRLRDVPAEDRTKVIVLSQVVTIVALLVLWSIIRSKRAVGRD